VRLFFAVMLPHELREAAAQTQAALRAVAGEDGIRWVRDDQMHLTLKFLGEVPVPRAYRAVDAAQTVSATHAPFDLALGGVGAFPTEARPSTLWVGLSAGRSAVEALAVDLDGALKRERFPSDRKALVPHLTLARVRSYAGEAAAVRALRALQMAPTTSVRIDRFALVQSTLGPQGSSYEVVEEFPLREHQDA